MVECYCLQLRQHSRTLCQLYDHYLQQADVQAGQFGLLMALSHRAATVNQLADFLVLDQSTMTRNLQVIQKMGWADSQTNPKDRREKLWQLTPEGQRMIDRVMPLWQQAQQNVEDHLAQLGLTDVFSQLEKLAQTLSTQA